MKTIESTSRDLAAQVELLRQELSKSEARFRDVIERNADAIVVVDTEGVIRFVNQEAEKLFDGRAGLLVGSPFGFPLVAGETTELDLVHDHTPVTVEMRVVESEWQGERAWIATLRNVTARKREEQQARELIRAQVARAAAEDVAGKFRFLAESTAVLSASLDSSHTLADLARLCTDEIADWVIIYSYEGDRLKRSEVMHCDDAHKDVVRALLEYEVNQEADAIASLVDTHKPQLAESVDEEMLARMVPDAEQRRIFNNLGISSFMLVPMVARQRLLGAIAFISAVPESPFKEADLQLALDLASRAALAIDNARLYEEARQANQAKSELLAIISHDLRTPLNSIIGYGQLLQLGIPEAMPDGIGDKVNRMMVSARHQLYLIDQLLDFARLDAQHEDVELRPVDVRDVVQEAVTLIEPTAAEKGIAVELELPPSPMQALTDADKLRQVVINLLANAVKYTQQGKVRVELEPDGSELSIRVHDSGIGIAAEHLPHIFEPFWQVDRGQRTRGGGTGLGLAVVKQVMELLGGSIAARSVAGDGSTFEVRLPAAISE